MSRYFLSPSIHWCALNGRCIILDVERDRYLQVSPQAFQSLLPFVQDGPCLAEIPPELSEAADELFTAGVFTDSPSHTPPRPVLSLARPTELLQFATNHTPVTEAIRVLPHFLKACATADYYLRFSSLSVISARISQRKLRLAWKSSIERFTKRAAELTVLYQSLRPFYPRDYVCMFDSLALLEFLAHWQIAPHWVFGVRVDPFEAHCWVQSENVVLSDTVSFSSRWFSPIMIF